MAAPAPTLAELLANHVEDDPADETVVRAASVAEAAVDHLIGDSTAVPADVRLEAILRTGSSIYYRRTARNGIVTFGEIGGETTPMRVSRDDLSEARVLLANWLPAAIA